MELNSTVLNSLQTCGNGVVLPDQLFSALIDNLFEIVCQRTEQKIEDTLAIKQGIEIEKVKESYYGLLTLVVEATHTNTQNESLSAVLDECHWPNDRIEIFNKAFNRNKKDLQVILARYGPTFPHIVDVRWRLDYKLKTNQLDKINEPMYFINLQTEEPGQLNDFKFACSIEQLQDLVGKLKDASKAIEKASQM